MTDWNITSSRRKNLAMVIDGVAEVSRPMLEERQTQLTQIRERKRVVNTEIQNIGDVLTQAGNKATNLRTLINNLAKLEKERADLEKESNQIIGNCSRLRRRKRFAVEIPCSVAPPQ